MSNLIILRGDLLDFKGELVHQVNCTGVAGAGLALQFRKRYPDWYKHYRTRSHSAYLGAVDRYYTSDGNTIISLFAQERIAKGNQLATDYEKLNSCLEKVSFQRILTGTFRPIYIPYGLGCGLANGDWSIVEPMINRHLPDAILVKKES